MLKTLLLPPTLLLLISSWTFAQLPEVETLRDQYGLGGVGLSVIVDHGSAEITVSGEAPGEGAEALSKDTRLNAEGFAETYVALKTLRSISEGLLALDTRLVEAAPGLPVANPYDAQDPVRLVHLLEHTAGFEEIAGGPLGIPAADQERTDRHRLLCRWPPGRFFSHSNLGPAVLLDILQKRDEGAPQRDSNEVAGLRPRLEDRFFEMDRTRSPHTSTPYPPPLDTSLDKLTELLRFFLQRGTLEGVSTLPEELVLRMESGRTTAGAKMGMQVGHGLGMETVVLQGHLFRRIQGRSREGDYLELAYLPQSKRGFTFWTRTHDSSATRALSDSLVRYLTSDLSSAPAEIPEIPPHRLRGVGGYYRPLTLPRESSRFLDRILQVFYIETGEDRIWIEPWDSPEETLFPVTDRRYRRQGEPIPTVVFLQDRESHALLQSYGEDLKDTFYRASGSLIWLERILAFLSLLMIATSLLYACFWIPRLLRKKRSVRAQPSLLWTPWIVSLLALLWIGLYPLAYWRGGLSPSQFSETASLSILLAYLISACAAPFVVVLAYGKARPGPLLHAWLVSLANLIVAVYCSYWLLV